MRKVLCRTAWLAAGMVLGGAMAVAELVLTVAVGLWLLPVVGASTRRRAVLRHAGVAAHWLALLERRRLERCYEATVTPGFDGARALRFVVTRWPLGLFGTGIPAVLVVGLAYATLPVWIWFRQTVDSPWTVISSGLGGLFLIFLCVQGLHGMATLEERLARGQLEPSTQELLDRRITELATSRAEVIEAVQDERRRIERYLHDGVQQRLVALGMLLGRADRTTDTARASQLLGQAQRETRRTLDELREVAWRIHPAILDEAGLCAAVEAVAERAGLPVELTDDLLWEPAQPVGTVAYFVVSEGVTNAVKHAVATRARVRLTQESESKVLRVCVEDDGRGGADPTGSGLTGLSRRVAALDGRLEVSSPPGGPTRVTAELPCD